MKLKDKLLFLVFYIEFKRFYDFYIDESKTSFEISLPIQLDTICSRFQYIVLLSNKDILFQELNLIKTKNSDNSSNNLYSFLLHKLNILFKSNIHKRKVIYKKTKGSFKKLYEFI